MSTVFIFIKRNLELILLSSFLVGSAILVNFIHPSGVSVDTESYLQAMKVLRGGLGDAQGVFVPNRVLTSFLSMQFIIFLSFFIHDTLLAWSLMNILFVTVTCLSFYFLLQDLFQNRLVSLVGVLLLFFNYAIVSFGLNYLMDMGGWMFYICSLFLTNRYYHTKQKKFLYLSSVCVSIGLFFKEYAILGLIPVLLALAYLHRNNIKRFFLDALRVGLISFVPIMILYIYVYLKFDYSYLNWFSFNYNKYQYSYSGGRILEYIKSFGSLYNIGWIFFVWGLFLLVSYIKNKNIFYINRLYFFCTVGLSVFPIFLWSAITQRILFPIVPFAIIISLIPFAKYKRLFYYSAPLLIGYIIINLYMDAYMLPLVNIDVWLKNFGLFFLNIV